MSDVINNPFEVRGLIRNQTPNSQLGQARDRVNQYHRVGDVVVAFVDGFSNPPEGVDPYEMTVDEHIMAAEATGKFAQFLHGKNRDDLVESGVYVGPCIVGLSTAPDEPSQDEVRVAIYQPELRF